MSNNVNDGSKKSSDNESTVTVMSEKFAFDDEPVDPLNDLTADSAESEITNPPDNDPEDLEVVEQYMSELLGRYGIDPTGVNPTSQQSGTLAHTTPPTRGSTESTDTIPATKASERDTEPIDPPVERRKKRRSPTTAPEKKLDMSSMRDLANSAARGAIASHSQQTTVQKAYIRLFGASAAIVLTFCAVHFTDVRQGFPFAFSLFTTSLAGFWSWQFCRTTWQLSRYSED